MRFFFALRPRLFAGRLPWLAFLTLCVGLAIDISKKGTE